MRKIIAGVIAVLLVLGLTACHNNGSNETQESAPTESTSATQAPTETQPGQDTQPVQPTESPTEPTEPATQPTEAAKPTEQQTVHVHSYSKKVVEGTCTQKGYTVYTCACGHSYSADYKLAPHKYDALYSCESCGAKHPNFDAYYADQKVVTDIHLEKDAELDAKIAACDAKIAAAEKAIKAAKAEKAGLTPNCPQHIIQQYVNRWQDFGSTAAATNAAKEYWTQQYNSKMTQLNNTISKKETEIDIALADKATYELQKEVLWDTYSQDLKKLKEKHGLT